MKVTTIKTKIIQPGEDIFSFLRESINSLEEKSIVIITSKIISFSQNRFVEVGDNSTREEKQNIAKQEADLYLDISFSKYGTMLTIKDSLLVVNAGIDESNSAGKYILWPDKLQQVTNDIWQFLRKEYEVRELGVIVTDSKTTPLRRGIIGTAMSHCGFKAIIDRVGDKDIFGKKLNTTKVSVMEAVAVSGVFEMGEGNEQQPLAIASEFQQPIEFLDQPPTEEELEDLKVEPSEDIYAPIIMSAAWKKGGGGGKK